MANDVHGPLRMTANDTDPVEAWLSDDNGPVNLSGVGAVVRFGMRSRAGGVVVQGVAQILDDGTVPQRGHVRYVFAPGQNGTPGIYDAEFQLTQADGSRATFPTHDKRTVIIEPEIITG